MPGTYFQEMKQKDCMQDIFFHVVFIRRINHIYVWNTQKKKFIRAALERSFVNYVEIYCVHWGYIVCLYQNQCTILKGWHIDCRIVVLKWFFLIWKEISSLGNEVRISKTISSVIQNWTTSACIFHFCEQRTKMFFSPWKLDRVEASNLVFQKEKKIK
jgi:hypothetical protein